jgi:short-subunit dehydrogenase
VKSSQNHVSDSSIQHEKKHKRFSYKLYKIYNLFDFIIHIKNHDQITIIINNVGISINISRTLCSCCSFLQDNLKESKKMKINLNFLCSLNGYFTFNYVEYIKDKSGNNDFKKILKFFTPKKPS